MVICQEILHSLKALGIAEGDTVLVHSSLKSFGRVENGADDVIDALLAAVGKNGTVVMPTFAMTDFPNAYKTWHMDKPSDTGYITEVFRKRPEAKRSNQPTHSVAAIGVKAAHLTETHGNSGLRRGTYGDTPFAADSPWQKLYDMNAKVIMLGADYATYTLRHLCEYTLVDKALAMAKERGKYEELVGDIQTFETRYTDGNASFWPYLNHVKCTEEILSKGFDVQVSCGQAALHCTQAKDVCDFIMAAAWENPAQWFESPAAAWYRRIQSL